MVLFIEINHCPSALVRLGDHGLGVKLTLKYVFKLDLLLMRCKSVFKLSNLSPFLIKSLKNLKVKCI
ncbi:hypothetical protein CHL9426_07410 [Campylobacter hyointestinalis subsp. lawsonii]|nr:hypothetical protein CHL9426_07410 [Campylobacter hyointestinalis subsp. lawsonii]RAZ49874.1 hypothetical protein CHL9004_04500 [Campylobacter hyointestinalis subsp. lawsonii]RAZ60451.1 hypothetical protein CHL10071_05910 [Campylobacter hyointestinalis subsp. lawsonii]